MKFSVRKQLNLSRIDKDMWPYESETYEAADADSLEEAQKIVDLYYAEREGFFRAKAEVNKSNQLPLPATPAPPVPNAAPDTPVIAPPAPGPATPPTTANPVPAPMPPVETGVSNQPPNEFS